MLKTARQNRITTTVLLAGVLLLLAPVLSEHAHAGAPVSKVAGTTTTVYVNDGLQEICEYDNGAAVGSPSRSYVFGSYIDEPLLMVNGGVKTYYHSNNLYSVAALTNAAGAVVERYTYDPYGKVKILAPDGVTVRTASSVGNPWAFTGRRLDGETGLMYYRARYYDVGLGRFISRDPIESIENRDNIGAYSVLFNTFNLIPVSIKADVLFKSLLATISLRKGRYFAGMNMYQYSNSAPSNFVDPSGLFGIDRCCTKFRYYFKGPLSDKATGYDTWGDAYDACVSNQTSARPAITAVSSVTAGAGTYATAAAGGTATGVATPVAVGGATGLAGWGLGSLVGCAFAPEKFCIKFVKPKMMIGKCVAICPEDSELVPHD